MAISAFFVLPLYAADIHFDNAWKQQKFSWFSKNKYELNGRKLNIHSDGSVSMLYLPLDEINWTTSKAKWAWNVIEGVPATDLRKKGGDDRNIAFYAVFLPKNTAKRLQNASIIKLLKSNEVRVLVYVWGGAYKPESVLESPYLGARGKTIILRSASVGSHMENVNFSMDYKRVFGENITSLVGLAISADSDDTNSSILATIQNLSLN
jgi:hypothetical protein